MRRLKTMIGLMLILVMVILPFQNSSASTYSKTATPSYTFQNTDGEFDVVYCTAILNQDYSVSNYLQTYGNRSQYFAIREVGCGGVDIWAVSGAAYKNSSGTVVREFSDWQYQAVIVPTGTIVFVSIKSSAGVTYPISNGYKYFFNYTLSGSEFFPAIAFPMIRNGNVELSIS